MANLKYVIGVIDSYDWVASLPVFCEADGSLSQMYPGHYYVRNALCHKRWRWLVKENKLDKSIMDWEPDVEEIERIKKNVARVISHYSRPDIIPRYSMEGQYPDWRKVYDPYERKS